MPLLRLLVAWLVLAALPLQGLAASSMLLCGQAAAAPAAVHEGHAAHGQGHDHHQAAAAHDGHEADPAAAADHGGADHKCPICGGLCHVLALPESTAVLASTDAPSAGLPQPGVPALTRVPPRPDKPPRA